MHASGDWTAFAERYRHELDGNTEAVASLRKAIREHGAATLVYASKETEHNNALVLKRMLRL